MADELEPTLGLCPLVKAAYDDPALTAGWQDFLGNDSGWWKGAAQMLQGMVFGVGLYDTCDCAGDVDLLVAHRTLSAPALFTACHTLQAGPALHLAPGADVDLRAGHAIHLHNLALAPNSALRLALDPTL